MEIPADDQLIRLCARRPASPPCGWLRGTWAGPGL